MHSIHPHFGFIRCAALTLRLGGDILSALLIQIAVPTRDSKVTNPRCFGKQKYTQKQPYLNNKQWKGGRSHTYECCKVTLLVQYAGKSSFVWWEPTRAAIPKENLPLSAGCHAWGRVTGFKPEQATFSTSLKEDDFQSSQIVLSSEWQAVV